MNLPMSRRLLFGTSAAAVVAASVPAAMAVTSTNPDAELVRLCTRMISVEVAKQRLYDGPGAPVDPDRDPIVGPQLDVLFKEYVGIKRQLEVMVPVTAAGAKAMARAAIADTPRDSDGTPLPGDDVLAWNAAEWLAGEDWAAWFATPTAVRDFDALPVMLAEMGGMRTLTRRLLLGSTAAGAATATAAAPTPSVNPDATLLAACAEFDRLEREYLSLIYGPKRIEDDDERDIAMIPNRKAQKPFWHLICTTEAKTLEGLRAKAKTVALEDWELFKDLKQDMDSEYINERLQASLMLNVFAVLGVKETLEPRQGDAVAQEVGA